MSELQMYDEAGDSRVEIQTDGSTLKPFFNAIRPLVDEARLQFDEDGLYVRTVDKTNAALLEIRLHADALEKYTLHKGSFITGINLAKTRHLIRRARMNSDDTLHFHARENALFAEVSRGFDDTDVVTSDTVVTLDPESVREEPEIPDLDVHTVSCSFEALEDAIEHVSSLDDYLHFMSDENDLLIKCDTDISETKARIDNAVPDDGEINAMFADDYLSKLLKSFTKAKANSIGIQMGVDLPVFFSFERTQDGEPIISGTGVQAPRVQK